MTYHKVKVEKLVVDKSIMIRSELSKDALARYRDLFRDKGTCPALKVQKDTMHVIDGLHRLQAAVEEGVMEVGCELLDIPDSEVRTLAYRFNKDHGVPLSLEERNRVIVDLYTKDGKTEIQIGEIVGLSQQAISKILAILLSSNTNNVGEKLNEKEKIVIIRLLLKGEKQTEIAKRFNITQGYVSQIKSEVFDSVLKSYQEGELKKEIADRIKLEASEVDAILQIYGDPLNFTPEEATLWPTFGIDERFGMRHPGNIPAGLVRNILCRLTKPGDLILDTFAGGGVVIDVCNDMINRKCEAFDITPIRDDIKRHDILNGPPETSRVPDLIFLDPPYGSQKEGEYSDKETDLANLSIEDYLKKMEQIFSYWDHGWLVCLTTVHTREGLHQYIPLPSKILEAMQRAGWRFEEWIVNQIGRTEGTSGLLISRLQRVNWWSRRDDLHILIGKKT